MFQAPSAHLQEVNDVSLPLVSAQDGHLQRMRIPEEMDGTTNHKPQTLKTIKEKVN